MSIHLGVSSAGVANRHQVLPQRLAAAGMLRRNSAMTRAREPKWIGIFPYTQSAAERKNARPK